VSTSAEKTLSCLKVLWDTPEGTSVLELATRADISRPAAARLVATLLAEGMLIRDARTRKVRLGLRLYELAARAVYRDYPLHIVNREIVPVAESLRRTVAFTVLENHDVVLLSRVEWVHERAVFSPAPFRCPWPLISAGRALAAFAPDHARRDLIAAAVHVDPTLDEKALLEVVGTIRRDGFAVVHPDDRVRASAVAVPLLNSENVAVGALSAFLGRSDVEPGQVLAVVDGLKMGTRMIAQGLGFEAQAGAEVP
jgi:DNA-binding IclR family transcriptional regulator